MADKIFVDATVKAKSDMAADAISAIKKAIADAVKASGTLTTDEPSNKKSPRWMLTCDFTGELDKEGKKFSGDLKMVLLVMNATASGATLKSQPGTFAELARPGKLTPADVKDVAAGLAESMMKKAVAHMKTLKA